MGIGCVTSGAEQKFIQRVGVLLGKYEQKNHPEEGSLYEKVILKFI